MADERRDVGTLLKLVVTTSDGPQVRRYHRAIDYYAADPDATV